MIAFICQFFGYVHGYQNATHDNATGKPNQSVLSLRLP